jgi:hypothetical protein
LIFGGYRFRAAEEESRDITMKRSEIGDPRFISWIRPHPEKDKRAHNLEKIDKGIFIADAVAVLEHKTHLCLHESVAWANISVTVPAV